MSRRNIGGVAGTLIAVALLLVATVAVAQSPEEIRAALSEAHARYKDLQEGKNADYIPALGWVDPKRYGTGAPNGVAVLVLVALLALAPGKRSSYHER